MAQNTRYARERPPDAQPSAPSLYALTKGPIFNSQFPAPKIRSRPIFGPSPPRYLFFYFSKPKPEDLTSQQTSKIKIF
jgi:hypothetical protein